MKGIIFFWLLAAGLGPGSAWAASEPKAQDDELLCIGRGAIVSANLALARDSAVANALTKGMEAYLLARLGPEVFAAHFQRLIQEVLPGARDAVGNYHILGEEQSGNQVEILVRLRVDKRVVEKRLMEAGILKSEESARKVLFLVSERKKGEISYWWQDPELRSAMTATDVALHNVFQEKGFAPVQRTMGPIQSDLPLKKGVSELSPQEAADWGRAFEADLVILGETDIPSSGPAVIRLRVADVGLAKILCQEDRVFPAERLTGEEGGMVKGLESMVSETVSALTPCLVRSGKSDEPALIRLSVRLENLHSLREATVFRGFLSKDVSGVQSVKQTRMKKDSVSFEVEFKGTQETFLNQVLNHENPPFPLEPGDLGAGEVVLMAQ